MRGLLLSIGQSMRLSAYIFAPLRKYYNVPCHHEFYYGQSDISSITFSIILNMILPQNGSTYSPPPSKKRQFLVQLYLAAARQLLAEKNFDDALSVLRLTQEHFPELVEADVTLNKVVGEAAGTEHNSEASHSLSKTAIRKREKRKEDESRNLELLDRLLPI